MDNYVNWIFDLDDTLYSERDYTLSALNFVGLEVQKLYRQEKFSELLLSLNDNGTVDPIAQAWSLCALPDAERSNMIAAMRAHLPSISLSIGAQTVLAHLRCQGRSYAIVTDGRGITQRAKIEALGCADAAYISISEEVGLSKLDLARFSAVADALPPGQYYYIGDNPKKDFFAPKQLGWKTIMLDHHGLGVHAQDLPDDPAYQPDYIIADLREIVPRLSGSDGF